MLGLLTYVLISLCIITTLAVILGMLFIWDYLTCRHEMKELFIENQYFYNKEHLKRWREAVCLINGYSSSPSDSSADSLAPH